MKKFNLLPKLEFSKLRSFQNETFTFMGMSFEDMTASSLFVVLLDDDKYGNDFLGAAKISLGLVSSRPSRGSLDTVSQN